jgi:thioredoxin-related protein
MRKWRRYTEITANIVLIIGGSLFCVFLVKNYVLKNDGAPRQNPSAKSSRPSLVGNKLSAGDIEWTKSEGTLLVVLQKGCRFCDESAPFYQRLTKALSTKPTTHIVAVFPGSQEENKQYLQDKKIDISDTKQLSPASLGVVGTPTLLLVDNAGVVVDEWRGKLSVDEEEQVINRLTK